VAEADPFGLDEFFETLMLNQQIFKMRFLWKIDKKVNY